MHIRESYGELIKYIESQAYPLHIVIHLMWRQGETNIGYTLPGHRRGNQSAAEIH